MSTAIDLALGDIEPCALNPRTAFDAEALAELAESMRASGLIQPIIVRAAGQGRYSLLAGERRWRAAALAGWATIPALVREAATDAEALAVMLAENLQRADLTAIEAARAYQRLGELGVSQSEIARRTGKAQATISNTLRLLTLPGPVQARVQCGELAPAAARALLPLAAFPDACEAMAARVVAHAIPTRTLERDVFATREWELARDGVVRALDHRTPWAWRRVCAQECPHGAFRETAGGAAGVCLMPAHYAELVARAGELPPPPSRPEEPAPDGADAAARARTWQRVRALLADAPALADSRLVALLCLEAISGTKQETLKALAGQEGLPEDLLAALLHPEATRLSMAEILARHGATATARLALLCLLRTEAEEAAHYRHPPRLAEWLLAEDGEAGERARHLRELVAPEAA